MGDVRFTRGAVALEAINHSSSSRDDFRSGRQSAGAPVVNPIEVLAMQIQQLPASIRWLHARPDAIQALACGTTIARGPRTRLLDSLLSAAKWPWLARYVARAGSFLFLVALALSLPSVRRPMKKGANLFFGIGAMREKELMAELAADRRAPVVFINETRLAFFAEALGVSFIDLYGEWRRVTAEVWDELANESAVGLPSHERRLTFLVQAHETAYLRGWFRHLKRDYQPVEPIVFSAASAVSYAAISAGLSAAYHLHGFLRSSLVFPNFDQVRCFTNVEKDHTVRRLPRASVRVVEEPTNLIHTDRVVAVAGCYGQETGLEECADFIAWARENRIPVVVRPHPRDHSGYFERWRTDQSVTFADMSMSFDEFLEHHRPRMLLSWYSTTLFDALRRGVVPVTVPLDPWRPMDMVFPFQDISLRWPEDRVEVERLVADHADSATLLARKRRIGQIPSAAA